jgi:hypothetical protein
MAQAVKYLHPKLPPETYRSVVRHDRLWIGYPLARAAGHQTGAEHDGPSAREWLATRDAPPDHDALSARDHADEVDPDHQAVIPPSLPWRFIGWLGSLVVALSQARQMLLQKNPDSLCHRVSGSVDPFKARSDQRLATLETARQLLLIIPEWEACFGRPFFPQFATRAGFD